MKAHNLIYLISLIYAGVLCTMTVAGIGYILYGVITGDIDTTNATFGIFDTLGN